MTLTKLGYEFGNCKEERIRGDINWYEIQYTEANGVQKVTFADDARVWTFGYEIDGQNKITKRYEFGPDKRWVGIHGVESANGIEKLGIITMNPTCVPIGGTLLIKDPSKETEPEVEEENKEPEQPTVKHTTPVIEPVKSMEKVRPVIEDSNWTITVVLFVSFIILLVALIVTCLSICARRRRLRELNKLTV